MRKNIMCMLAVVLAVLFPCTAVYANDDAAATTQKVYVNDDIVNISGYNINGNNYFMLRDLENALCGTSAEFNVGWDKESSTITISTSDKYYDTVQQYHSYPQNAKAVKSDAKIEADGKILAADAYTIDQNNYFKLRDLAEFIPFSLTWSQNDNSVFIYTDIGDNAVIAESSGGITKKATKDLNYCASPITSYIYNNNDTSFVTADAGEGVIRIDEYSKNGLQLISSKCIKYELPIFGGIYSGDKYNYAVFGQANTEENNSLTTVKTVKYSKDWQKIGESDYKNNNTTVPFAAGSLRMCEYNGFLYVRTAHQMYQTPDGFNHQANLTYCVDTDKMTIADKYSGIMNISYGYVSHSLDQYIAVDDGKLVALDLGDAHPRSVVLVKYDSSLKGGKFMSAKCRNVDLLSIDGKIGDTDTGISIGGFEVSDNNYIAAVGSEMNSASRNIMLLVNPKNSVRTEKIFLTDYNGEKTASKPYLVKLADGTFEVIWEEFSGSESLGVNYVNVSENGRKLSDVKTLENCHLSYDCTPVTVGEDIIWYVNQKGGRIFYKIAIK